MSRPRVFYILGSLAQNDTGEEIVAILGRLSRAQFEPRVVALGGQEDLHERIVDMKVRSYPLGLSGSAGTLLAVPKVNGLLKRLGADVVHGFGSWGGSVAQLAAPRDVSVVRTVTRPPNHEKDLRGRLLRFLERRARRRVKTHYVVPNEGSRGLAVRAYGALDGRISVLPTSVDINGVRKIVAQNSRDQARVLLGIGQEQITFTLITDFDSGARMDEILTGFATAIRERDGLRLFIVGSGRYESSTRWKAEELRLGDSVVFLGRADMSAPIWAACDVAVDATPWSSWSRQALVAIAAGVPTLKRQEGVVGWSEDSGEELPMISGHPDRFASELVRLAANPDVRREIQDHGTDIAEEVDVGNVAERLGSLYQSLAT